MTTFNARDRRALLFFAQRACYRTRAWHWRLWWRAVDLLPDAQDMPVGLYAWGYIAESMAMSNRVIR